MELVLILGAYAMLVFLLIRFAAFIHQRDEEISHTMMSGRSRRKRSEKTRMTKVA
ncbi:MAG TPA: hypothetical protein VMM58_05805 [Bacteroidota bacterium]|nr:hypothetical protein [Bacteroidota bacterium]